MNVLRVAAVALLGAFAVGCSGASPSSPEVSLRGTYRAVGAGPYARMTFLDGEQFSVFKSNCSSDCVQNGNYTINGAASVLSLRDSETGSTVELPFSQAESADGTVSAQDEALHTEGVTGLASGAGGSLTADGGSLATDAGTSPQLFRAGGQLFTKSDALTADWTTIGFGIGGKSLGAGNNVLVVYGGYSATDQDSRALALALAGTTTFGGLDIGSVYASRGPRDPYYHAREMGNSELVTALKPEATAADVIIVIAHSSGAFVADELFTEAPDDVLSKIAYFALDGGTWALNNALIAKMKAVSFVYAKDAVAGESANAGSMIQEHMEFTASNLFMVDADGSGCNVNAVWCLHDTLVTTRPHNPATYDLHLDYQDFTGTGRHVVTSYVDQAIANKIIAP